MPNTLLERCESLGIRLTEQRRAVVQVLDESSDHPNVAELHERSLQIDPHISIATVYRAVKLLEEVGLLEKHDFGDGLARYEDAERDHHDHLIDISSRRVIEFVDEEIEELQVKIARRLGFELRGHRMELYGIPDSSKGSEQ